MAKVRAEIEIDLKKGTATMVQFEKKAIAELDKVGKKADSVASKFGKGLASAAKKAALAITALSVAGVAATLKFEERVGNVQTLLEDRTQIISYRKELIRMAKEGFGKASELADGLYQTISAGVKGPIKQLAFLEKATIAAKVGLASTLESVDLGTTVLNAFGLSADKAGQVFDEIQTTIQQGKTTFRELAASVGQVAPTFATANLSTKEMFAGLSTLTAAGIDTASAATLLKNTVLAIIKPIGSAKTVAAGLGIELSQAALDSKGFAGVMEQVKEKTKGSSEALTQIFPNIRAFSAAAIFAGKGSAKLAEDLEAQANATGKLADIWEDVQKRSDIVLKKMKDTAEAFLIDAFTPLVQGFAEFFAQEENMESFGNTLEEAFGFIAGVTQGAVDLFVDLAKGVGEILKGDLFPALIETLKETGALVVELAIDIKNVLVASFKLLSPILTPLVDTINLLSKSLNVLKLAVIGFAGLRFAGIIGAWSTALIAAKRNAIFYGDAVTTSLHATQSSAARATTALTATTVAVRALKVSLVGVFAGFLVKEAIDGMTAFINAQSDTRLALVESKEKFDDLIASVNDLAGAYENLTTVELERYMSDLTTEFDNNQRQLASFGPQTKALADELRALQAEGKQGEFDKLLKRYNDAIKATKGPLAGLHDNLKDFGVTMETKVKAAIAANVLEVFRLTGESGTLEGQIKTMAAAFATATEKVDAHNMEIGEAAAKMKALADEEKKLAEEEKKRLAALSAVTKEAIKISENFAKGIQDLSTTINANILLGRDMNEQLDQYGKKAQEARDLAKQYNRELDGTVKKMAEMQDVVDKVAEGQQQLNDKIARMKAEEAWDKATKSVQEHFDALDKTIVDYEDFNIVMEKSDIRLHSFGQRFRQFAEDAIGPLIKVRDHLDQMSNLFEQLGIAGAENLRKIADGFDALAQSAAHFASGNILGGVIGAISAGASFISAIFGGGKSAAEKAAEREAQRLVNLEKSLAAFNKQIDEAIDGTRDWDAGMSALLETLHDLRFEEEILQGAIDRVSSAIASQRQEVMRLEEQIAAFPQTLHGMLLSMDNLKRSFQDSKADVFHAERALRDFIRATDNISVEGAARRFSIDPSQGISDNLVRRGDSTSRLFGREAMREIFRTLREAQKSESKLGRTISLREQTDLLKRINDPQLKLLTKQLIEMENASTARSEAIKHQRDAIRLAKKENRIAQHNLPLVRDKLQRLIELEQELINKFDLWFGGQGGGQGRDDKNGDRDGGRSGETTDFESQAFVAGQNSVINTVKELPPQKVDVTLDVKGNKLVVEVTVDETTIQKAINFEFVNDKIVKDINEGGKIKTE